MTASVFETGKSVRTIVHETRNPMVSTNDKLFRLIIERCLTS